MVSVDNHRWASRFWCKSLGIFSRFFLCTVVSIAYLCELMAELQQSPVAPGALLLLLGDSGILVFSCKAYAGHPWFHSFRALGSFQFSLEHGLESVDRFDLIYNVLVVYIECFTHLLTSQLLRVTSIYFLPQNQPWIKH